ncbi:MAG: hypothetical protein KDK70_08090 [Myxococcales bacterium]|nr:hypothetical protein [Myxococcales bacterium]
MCLFAVDGTWSVDFNSRRAGNDQVGRPVGNQAGDMRSNTRRFFEESKYPDGKKFYFRGPDDGIGGSDSTNIYRDVLACIDAQIEAKNCDEIVMVGWSRGAAIISELTQGLAAREGMPTIKYVGLFDSVAMITARSPVDERWAEAITPSVENFAHVIAGDRTGEATVLGRRIRYTFVPADPTSNAKNPPAILHLAQATHGGVGGDASSEHAKISYDHIRNQASKVGVP